MKSVKEILNEWEANMAALDLEYQVYKASCAFHVEPMGYLEWKASKSQESVSEE